MYVVLGLNIVEVAHDFQQQVKAYITDELHLINSYDTWHGITFSIILHMPKLPINLCRD